VERKRVNMPDYVDIKNYVKYIVCPMCDEGYYTNKGGNLLHVEVCQVICKECAEHEPWPPEDPELQNVGP
jgi:hypothetical protein